MQDAFVWVVKKQADTVEGKGGTVLDSIWEADAEEQCAAYIDTQPGIMGRREKWSEQDHGDWTMEKVPLFNTTQDKADRDRAVLRRKALLKLSDAEKEALGVA